MTLAEVRDSFYADYKFLCQARRVPEIEIRNKQLALWLSEAQQDIANRVKPIKTYQDVSVVANATDYSLNSNFGQPVLAEVSGLETDIVNLNDIRTTDTSTTSSTAARCAIYWDSANGVYKVKVDPTPTDAYTLRIWYFVDTLFYSPSGSTAQDWGSFDGITFTGDMKIPDKFLMPIKYFMLGKIFDDYMVKYEMKIREMRGASADSMAESFDYNMGL